MKNNKNDDNVVREAGPNVYIVGNRCYRCSYEWRSNNMNKLPRVCPKCKSPYWDRPKTNGEHK